MLPSMQDIAGQLSMDHIVELTDRIFLTVFARYRRRLGDINLRWAWVRALGEVAGFLIPPVSVLAFVLIILAYALSGRGSPADHMRCGKATTVVIWLGIAFILQARFTRYLKDPPPLRVEESSEDRQALRTFHGICIGIFLAGCAAAVALNLLGEGSQLGF